jgi:hypothetical protein
MMGARRGVERGNKEGKKMMAGLRYARLGNVMTYGFMNNGMVWAGKDNHFVWLYNGRVGCQMLCLFYTYHAS